MMTQDEAKSRIAAEFITMLDKERTKSKAASLAFKYSPPSSPYYFKCSGDNYQVIMGWLEQHILER